MLEIKLFADNLKVGKICKHTVMGGIPRVGDTVRYLGEDDEFHSRQVKSVIFVEDGKPIIDLGGVSTPFKGYYKV